MIQEVHAEYIESDPPATNLTVTNLSNKYALSQHSSKKLSHEALAIRYESEGQFIAIGCKNGSKILYSTDKSMIVERVQDVKENPITSLKWKPSVEGKHKILVTADSGGNIAFLHVPSLKIIFNVHEDDNSVHSLDFTRTGQQFATGGKDCHVRIYDEETKTVSIDCKPASWNHQGHDNRIFAVKYIDDHTLMSGGWDSVVHIWDVRTGKSIKHFYGANISGQSLDFQNGKILAGCYSAKNQIQFWDYKSLQKVEEIDWTHNIDEAEYIYTAAFSKRDPFIFAAGSTGPKSELRVFGENNEGKHEVINSIKGLSQGCFSLDFSARQDQFAFATPHHGFYVYDLKKNKQA